MQRLTVVLITLYAFAVPWEYSLDLGEPFGNIARVLGVLVLAAGIPCVLADRETRRPGWLQWLVLALYLFFVSSYFWTVDQQATLDKMRAYFQVMMIVWILWQVAITPREFRGILRALVAGCWVLAVLTFLNFSSASAVAAEQIRFVAEGQDPNDVARFLDLGIPFAALLFATDDRWLARWLALGYLPAALLAVLLTASRGGFSGSLVALIGAAILLLRWRPRAAAGVLAAGTAMAGALWALVPAESFERLATIPEQVGSGDLNERLSLWAAGWQAFAKAPLLGYGAGTYVTAANLAPNDTAHNTLMAVLVMGGLVGAGILLAIVMTVGRAALRTHGLLRVALVSGLAVWVVTAMVGSVEENRTTWLLFGLTALAGRFAQEEPMRLAGVFSGVRTGGAPAAAMRAVLLES